jgi:shikimate dehydrogenase
MKVDAETILCATIAYPNRTAKSPIMHNAGFEALGINYVYMAFEPKASALAGAFAGMRALEIRGFSVSKPYKETVILIGYNSDWIGAANGIEEVTPIQGKRVVIVGAGGAGRAIAYGLKEKGGNVVIYNRSKERAQQLSSELGIEFGGGLDEFQQLTDYDILINATSVGSVLDVENMVIPRHLLQKGKVVLDAVFSPTITRLVKEACEAGCHVVLGIRMLVLQGAFQFKLFTGYDPPLDVMQKVLEKSLAK